MGRGAWRATDYGETKETSQEWLRVGGARGVEERALKWLGVGKGSSRQASLGCGNHGAPGAGGTWQSLEAQLQAAC